MRGRADQGTTIAGEIDAWFATHLKDEPEAQGAPAVRHQLQDGSFRALDALTEPTAAATGVATLVNAVAPTSGQVTAGTPGGADSTRISFALDPGVQIVGIPRVRVVATSLTNAPESYAFFKLVDVDTTTGEATVIDDQTTALKIAWAGALVGARRVVEIDLAGVAWSVEPGHQVSLEISPTSNDHASSRFLSVTQLAVDASLPVIAT